MNIVSIIHFSVVNGSHNYSNRESWFLFRAKIFEATIYKSILNNILHPSCIIICYDTNDKLLSKKYMKPILENSEIDIIEIYQTYSLITDSIKDILLDMYSGKPLLITRLDSDDFISINYYNMFHQYALNVDNNLKYIISAKGFRTNLDVIYSIYDLNPPFIGLVINSYNGQLIDVSHNEIFKLQPIIIKERFLWMQFVHGTNRMNNILSKKSYIFFKFKKILKFILAPKKNTFNYFNYSKFKPQLFSDFCIKKNDIRKIEIIIKEFTVRNI